MEREYAKPIPAAILQPLSEMFGTLYEIVNERLPRGHPVAAREPDHAFNIRWEKVDQKACSPNQLQTFILDKLGHYLGWPLAKYEYPVVDDPHQDYISRSADYPNEKFLESKVYQSWKARKTRGPSLLCATGLGVSPSLIEQQSPSS